MEALGSDCTHPLAFVHLYSASAATLVPSRRANERHSIDSPCQVSSKVLQVLSLPLPGGIQTRLRHLLPADQRMARKASEVIQLTGSNPDGYYRYSHSDLMCIQTTSHQPLSVQSQQTPFVNKDLGPLQHTFLDQFVTSSLQKML